MLLCEKCEKYYFPEVDEDGHVSMGCKSPSVIDVFCNFVRRFKCKYYRKISYEKMLKEIKNLLRRLIWYNRKGKTIPGLTLWYVLARYEEYLDFKDYLFRIIK